MIQSLRHKKSASDSLSFQEIFIKFVTKLKFESMKLRLTLFILIFMFVLSAGAKTVQDNRTKVILKTSKGDITIALYDETPLHRDNFIKLASSHYFDSLLFHRVIPNFMIQTGDPDSRHAQVDTHLGEGGPGYEIPAEIKFPQLFHKRGAVAAARTGDEVNPERKSSGSQFYIVWGQEFTGEELDDLTSQMEQHSGGRINFPTEVKKAYLKYGGTPHLDGSYTVFGEVVNGLNVVDKIQSVQINDYDRPFDDIRILSTEVVKPQ